MAPHKKTLNGAPTIIAEAQNAKNARVTDMQAEPINKLFFLRSAQKNVLKA
jgi:hypothetical protein